MITIEIVSEGNVKLFELQTREQKAVFSQQLDKRFGVGNWKILDIKRVTP